MLITYEDSLKVGKPIFDVFNVATADYITVTEIAEIACKVAGLNIKDVNFQYSGGDRGWKGDVPKVLFDIEKIKKLKWKATKNSYEAIEKSIESMEGEF